LVGAARCSTCGACTHACPSGALVLIGQRLSVDEILDVVLRDEPFYRHSGGGVTLSGGECTAFPEFVGELLARLHSHGISAAIETCGEFSYAQFAQWILPHADLILLDVKLANDQDHLRFTGRSNQRIWANLARLLATAPERVQPRIPLIPGITATRENLAALAARLAQLGARSLTLLPYNPLGIVMAESLGRPVRDCLPEVSAWAEQGRETIAWFKTEAARHCFEVLSA
jgi:pyruvate formate lyase activating enzyme